MDEIIQIFKLCKDEMSKEKVKKIIWNKLAITIVGQWEVGGWGRNIWKIPLRQFKSIQPTWCGAWGWGSRSRLRSRWKSIKLINY